MHSNFQKLVLFSFLRGVYLLKFPQSIRIEWNGYQEREVTKCMCESRVQPQFVKKMIEHSEYTNDPCFKCYLKCLDTNDGLMDGNGNYIVNALVLHLANVTKAIAEDCVNLYISIPDPCEMAYHVGLCLMDKLSV